MTAMFVFIETRVFTRLADEYLSDDELSRLQHHLNENPEAGDIIRASGGVRKLRWGAPGRGKRAGLRIVYFLRSQQGEIWLRRCTPRTWPRAFQATFFGRSGRRLMANRKRDIGQEILDGIREIKRGEHGRVTTVPSVSSIREKTGLSQAVFAKLLGVSVRTLQELEQGRRAPSGAARTLLLIAAKNPRALLEVA